MTNNIAVRLRLWFSRLFSNSAEQADNCNTYSFFKPTLTLYMTFKIFYEVTKFVREHVKPTKKYPGRTKHARVQKYCNGSYQKFNITPYNTFVFCRTLCFPKPKCFVNQSGTEILIQYLMSSPGLQVRKTKTIFLFKTVFLITRFYDSNFFGLMYKHT